MSWQSEVQQLVDAGHASDFAEGRELRKQILSEDKTVKGWIKAQPKTTVHGSETADNADVDEMSDLTALMQTAGIGFGHAQLLRKQILESGKSVKEWILYDSQHGDYGLPDTTVIFRRAGELISLAGSKERAIDAIEAYSSLDSSAPPAE